MQSELNYMSAYASEWLSLWLFWQTYKVTSSSPLFEWNWTHVMLILQWLVSVECRPTSVYHSQYGKTFHKWLSIVWLNLWFSISAPFGTKEMSHSRSDWPFGQNSWELVGNLSEWVGFCPPTLYVKTCSGGMLYRSNFLAILVTWALYEQ
jgi:hypothetical protein